VITIFERARHQQILTRDIYGLAVSEIAQGRLQGTEALFQGKNAFDFLIGENERHDVCNSRATQEFIARAGLSSSNVITAAINGKTAIACKAAGKPYASAINPAETGARNETPIFAP